MFKKRKQESDVGIRVMMGWGGGGGGGGGDNASHFSPRTALFWALIRPSRISSLRLPGF